MIYFLDTNIVVFCLRGQSIRNGIKPAFRRFYIHLQLFGPTHRSRDTTSKFEQLLKGQAHQSAKRIFGLLRRHAPLLAPS